MHVSELRKEGRVADVADVVTKSQKVLVKVLSVTGTKASLSMKASRLSWFQTEEKLNINNVLGFRIPNNMNLINQIDEMILQFPFSTPRWRKKGRWRLLVLHFTLLIFSQDVDQATGEDLNPNRRRIHDPVVREETLRNPDRPVEATVFEMQDDSAKRKRLAKITDLEKWEIKQVPQTRCPL